MLKFEQTWRELSATLLVSPDKPRENARNSVAALWQLAVGRPMSVETAELQDCQPLTPTQEATFLALLQRRLAGEPLAYITGRHQFFGVEFVVDRSALIPRSETELLAKAAIDLARSLSDVQRPLLVLDVCTGSGNLAVALALHTATAYVHAADASREAVDLAVRNVAMHALGERVFPVCGDLFAPFEAASFRGQVDLITCNPPYISSRNVSRLPGEIAAFEPAMAFDGGPFGVGLLRRLIRDAPRFLRPGGFLAFEIGLGQGRSLRQWIERVEDYDHVSELASHGDVRVLVARRSQGRSSQ